MRDLVFILHLMLCCLFLSFGTLSSSALAGVKDNTGARIYMYRYKDSSGRDVISQQVPSDAYQYGYDALDRNGDLLYSVPPPLTDEERKAYHLDKQQKKQREEQLARDQTLLRTYSSPEDARQAKARKMQQLDVTIDIMMAKKNQSRFEYEYLLEKAAEQERMGQPVQESILEEMDGIENQIENLEKFIQDKQVEKKRIEQDYDRLIKRLEKLFAQRKEERAR